MFGTAQQREMTPVVHEQVEIQKLRGKIDFPKAEAGELKRWVIGVRLDAPEEIHNLTVCGYAFHRYTESPDNTLSENRGKMPKYTSLVVALSDKQRDYIFQRAKETYRTLRGNKRVTCENFIYIENAETFKMPTYNLSTTAIEQEKKAVDALIDEQYKRAEAKETSELSARKQQEKFAAELIKEQSQKKKN